MSWQPLAVQPGIVRRMRIDPETTNLVMHTEQDVSDVLQLNQAFLNAERASSSLWGGSSYVRVAQVPLVWIEQLMQKGMNVMRDKEAQAKMLGMLSSNEFSGFRTAPGRLA